MNNNFLYEINGDEVIIKEYTGNEAVLDIPEKIDGMPVCVIGERAFYNNRFIEEVHIPEGVYIIERDAFKSCNMLKKVHLPNSMYIISAQAFLGCKKLQYINFPVNIRKLSDRCFYGCESLLSIDVNGATRIGMGVFAQCSSLKKAALREVKEIDTRAFAYCAMLDEVILSADVSFLKDSFCGTPYFEKFKKNRFVCLKNTLIAYFGDDEIVEIPAGIKNIGRSAFENNKSVRKIIGNEVEYIADYAFYGCTGLTMTHFTPDVKICGKYSFYGCISYCKEADEEYYVTSDIMQYPAVLGAIIGDVSGSYYEICNIKTIPNKLLTSRDYFTDDTVLTIAVFCGLKQAKKKMNGKLSEISDEVITKELKKAIIHFVLKYPNSGYGAKFINWIKSKEHAPYNSWGNGSAMRCSAAGSMADSLDEAEHIAKLTADITHNHEDAIKGAQAVSGAVYMALHGRSKKEIKDYIKGYYPDVDSINFDIIRDKFVFDVSCKGTVPYSCAAFFRTDSFDEALKLIISIGGDSDTLACITGAIAGAYYGVSDAYKCKIKRYISDFI